MSRKQTDTRYKVRFKSMKSFGKRLSIHMLAAVTAAAVMVSPVLAAGIPQLPEDYHSPFSDVGENQWFYPFVCTLNLNDVIAGYDDGRFGPYDNTKAGDAILMVMKATGSGNQFPAQGEHYAAGYVNYAVSQGWLTKEEVPASLDGEISRLFIARLAAKAVANSALLKAAMFGADANWGRVLCAIGYSGAAVDVHAVDVAFASAAGSIDVCRNGAGIPVDEDKAKGILSEKEIVIDIRLHDGDAAAVAFGCDLTYEYVHINAAYHT